MLRAALLASLAVLTASARAAAAAPVCLPEPGIGCYYVPESAPADAPLLVFLRGHHPVYGKNVPAGQFLESSRRAFSQFELGRIANEKAVAVLITYRSALAVTDADVAALGRKTGRTFPKTILASHSGSYTGLTASIDAGMRPSRFILLDSFYGGDDGLAQKLQRIISTGAGCSGFYTPHNKANFDAAFRNGIACAVDEFDSDRQHNPAVNRCLAGYLDGRSCAPASSAPPAS